MTKQERQWDLLDQKTKNLKRRYAKAVLRETVTVFGPKVLDSRNRTLRLALQKFLATEWEVVLTLVFMADQPVRKQRKRG